MYKRTSTLLPVLFFFGIFLFSSLLVITGRGQTPNDIRLIQKSTHVESLQLGELCNDSSEYDFTFSGSHLSKSCNRSNNNRISKIW